MKRPEDNKLILWILAGAAAALTLAGDPLSAQEQPAAPGEDVMLIETKISYEQIDESGSDHVSDATMGDGAMGIKPDKPVVREDELIILNRTLRHLIEENDQLREDREELDRQLRSMRGQRAIEQNRINAMVMERDAYKQQTDQVLVLREQMEKDVNAFREKVVEREGVLKTRIAELEVQLKETKGETEGGEGGGETDAVTADQKKGRALMQMVDSLNEKDEQLRADEAKVRYNMGNIFFKQGEYRKAAQEYRAAVELAPQDANAHYNLALVSGSYLYDHATAMKHYQQYLFLNPEAEDMPLVKEKILEAELFLRGKVPTVLEQDLEKHERRIR